MVARTTLLFLGSCLVSACAPHAPTTPVYRAGHAPAFAQPLKPLQTLPAGFAIEVTFTPTTPFVDKEDCYRWPSHCIGGLKGGVYPYRAGEALYYQYLPVGSYAMKVVVSDEKTPANKREQTLPVQLGNELSQVEIALSDSSKTTITLRGEATQRYDGRICDGGGSGGSLHSSSTKRIVCSVTDVDGTTWSMESSSPREMYDYMQLQMCSGAHEGVIMRHSQFAATFACRPADPQSALKPGELVERKAAK
jgi:hypothetical protein